MNQILDVKKECNKNNSNTIEKKMEENYLTLLQRCLIKKLNLYEEVLVSLCSLLDEKSEMLLSF